MLQALNIMRLCPEAFNGELIFVCGYHFEVNLWDLKESRNLICVVQLNNDVFLPIAWRTYYNLGYTFKFMFKDGNDPLVIPFMAIEYSWLLLVNIGIARMSKSLKGN